MKTIKNTSLKSIIFTTLLASKAVFAVSPASGQLIIVNNLSNVTSAGNAGSTESGIKVEVYDTANSIQPCTTVTLPYNGVTIVRWFAIGVHSSTSCAGTGIGSAAISHVNITPLARVIGNTAQVVYDAAPHLPQTKASPITFTPPTFIYENIALVISGNGSPSTTSGQTADQTHWGFTINPATPIFDAGNGAIAITGVPGVEGAYGVTAGKLLKRYGIPR